jgi:biopolymer transport protein ExbB
MLDLWTRIVELVDAGGWIMPFLIGLAALGWYTLAARWLHLSSRLVSQAKTDIAHNQELPGAAELVVAEFKAKLPRYRDIVRTVAVIAPLAGLLGTVGGMIETFKGLASMELFTQSGGVAGGISEALLTTQMGLAVAVPTIIIGRLLDRRENLLRGRLDQLRIHTAESTS